MSDERMKETLSALMDDEATELEVRRMLMQGDQEALQATWSRYHQVRAVLREEESDWATVDLLAGIHAALDGEDEPAAGREAPVRAAPAATALPDSVPTEVRSGWLGWLGGAVAAAVLVAGVWLAQPVGPDAAGQVAELDPAVQPQLQAYLMKHLQYSAMNSGQLIAYARLNSADPLGE